ncbi:MAG: LysM peptidoglycan-binding domain-containing protein, partial [Verrucomicrobia bacterium]|nr:LysM peptidoglycan-binding domain-containing protein [Verrucomicrobiota bacterium]
TRSRLESLQSGAAARDTELAGLRQQAEAAAAAQKTAAAERAALAAEKERLAAELASRSTALTGQATEATSRIQALTAELEAARKERAALAEKLSAALRTYELVNAERGELARQVKGLADQLAATTAALPTSETRTQARPLVAVRSESVRPGPGSTDQTRITVPLAAPAPTSSPVGIRPPQRPAPVAATAVPVAPPAPPPVRLHTIAAGETLSSISRRYYGTANRWPEILAANRDSVRDERSLIAGRTLRIP